MSVADLSVRVNPPDVVYKLQRVQGHKRAVGEAWPTVIRNAAGGVSATGPSESRRSVGDGLLLSLSARVLVIEALPRHGKKAACQSVCPPSGRGRGCF